MSREDLDALLNVALPFAQRMLGAHGEFYPFGAVVTADGAAHLVSGFTEEDHPASSEVTRALLAELRSGVSTKMFRATAVCTDVRIRHPDTGEESDAIEVSLEARDDEALNVYLPYREEGADRYAYGELLATKAAPRVFVSA